MKKILSLILLSSMILVGCKVEEVTSLQDYYLTLTKGNIQDLSLDKIKKSLSNFKYERELMELSKEEPVEGVTFDDISFNKFTDEDGIELEINCNETNKKIDTISLKKENSKENKLIIYSDTFLMSKSSITNIETVKNLVKNLNLHDSLQTRVDPYIELMDKLNKNEAITIEQVQEILKLKEFTKDENEELQYTEYTFNTNNDYLWLSVTETENKLSSSSATIRDTNLNYIIRINYYDGVFDVTVSPNNEETMNDEKSISKLNKDLNESIYNFIFKDGTLNIYKNEITKEEEKQNKILGGALDIKADRNMFESYSKNIEALYDYEQNKSFKFYLEKGQGLKFDINIKDLEEIKVPMTISLNDENNNSIYEKEVTDIKENTFLLPKVENDGNYILTFDFKESKDFTFELYIINE